MNDLCCFCALVFVLFLGAFFFFFVFPSQNDRGKGTLWDFFYSNSSENLIPKNLRGSGGGLQALGLGSCRKRVKIWTLKGGV